VVVPAGEAARLQRDPLQHDARAAGRLNVDPISGSTRSQGRRACAGAGWG
jgi:hypothetical protein